MDGTFRALSHPARRAILDIVKESPGATVQQVSGHFEMSRIGVMKHINLLDDAELLVSEREGRERRLYFNAVPIRRIYDRWTTEYSSLWADRLTGLKYRLEAKEES